MMMISIILNINQSGGFYSRFLVWMVFASAIKTIKIKMDSNHGHKHDKIDDA